MGFDTSEMRALSVDMGAAASRLAPRGRATIMKAAVNIKGTMRRDAEASKAFKGISPAISFDTFERPDAFEIEIGPEHGPGQAGNLANVAYFGTSRGGGTVRDPQAALDEEQPRLEAALADIAADSL